MKIFYLRHQAAGVLYQYPFVATPTQAQIAQVGKLCELLHGERHPKTDQPYWLRVVETEALDASAQIALPNSESNVRTLAKAEVPRVAVSGKAHVENPK